MRIRVRDRIEVRCDIWEVVGRVAGRICVIFLGVHHNCCVAVLASLLPRAPDMGTARTGRAGPALRVARRSWMPGGSPSRSGRRSGGRTSSSVPGTAPGALPKRIVSQTSSPFIAKRIAPPTSRVKRSRTSARRTLHVVCIVGQTLHVWGLSLAGHRENTVGKHRGGGLYHPYFLTPFRHCAQIAGEAGGYPSFY